MLDLVFSVRLFWFALIVFNSALLTIRLASHLFTPPSRWFQNQQLPPIWSCWPQVLMRGQIDENLSIVVVFLARRRCVIPAHRRYFLLSLSSSPLSSSSLFSLPIVVFPTGPIIIAIFLRSLPLFPALDLSLSVSPSLSSLPWSLSRLPIFLPLSLFLYILVSERSGKRERERQRKCERAIRTDMMRDWEWGEWVR